MSYRTGKIIKEEEKIIKQQMKIFCLIVWRKCLLAEFAPNFPSDATGLLFRHPLEIHSKTP